MNNNDLKYQALVDFLGTTGHIDDLELSWLNGETGESSITDGWHTYLIDQGYTGQLNNMQFQWLGDAGHTGSLGDRFSQYWLNGIPSVLDIASAFSIDLWTGDAVSQNIVNGIDLSTDGGMVWIRHRNQANNHVLFDTLRGIELSLRTNTVDADTPLAGSLTSFNIDGYDLGTQGQVNLNAGSYVGWSFKKAPKFFDVIKYTGDGTNGRAVPHGLGILAGLVTVKRVDAVGEWNTQHTAESGMYGRLNNSNAFIASTTFFSQDADDTNFYVNNTADTNGIGNVYTAYVFAHDIDPDGVIKCGSYIGNGTTVNSVVLGWVPQFLLIKRVTGIEDWYLLDTTRGINVGIDPMLKANLSDAELTASDRVGLTSDGFKLTWSSADFNLSGDTYIYMAIRGVAP